MLHQLRVTVSLAMARNVGFLGGGIVQILRLIDEAGAMTEAGVKLLKAVRSPAVGMVLTPAGRAYAERFERWREKAELLLRQSFVEEFSSYE